MTARKISLMVLLPLCLAVFVAGVWAQQERPWIHIHVSEGGDDDKEVRVNLPFGLAQVALGVVSDEIVSEGRLELKNHDISVEELRQMWLELKNSGDAEFVSVGDDDKSVRVAREGDRLVVSVDGHGGADDSKSVRIDVPVTLVDALFAGEGSTLDLEGALASYETSEATLSLSSSATNRSVSGSTTPRADRATGISKLIRRQWGRSRGLSLPIPAIL